MDTCSSLQDNCRATYCLFNVTMGSGGTAVAVQRMIDASGNDCTILATAAHCVSAAPDEVIELISFDGLRYGGARVLVYDRLHDLAFIAATGLPDEKVANIPGARVRAYPAVGSNVYAIGWPALLDQHSVSKGCVRSSTWSAWGVNYILTDAPIVGGNSGGGVFDSETHELVGLVSFGFLGDDISGVVPAYCVSEGTRMLSELDASGGWGPSPMQCFSRNEYYLGTAGWNIPFNIYPYIAPREVPSLARLAAAGMYVHGVAPESPASSATVNPGDIIWALRLSHPSNEGDWVPITQLKSLDSIIHELSMSVYVASLPKPINKNTRFRTTYGRGIAEVPALRDADPRLPSTIEVDLLVSGFCEGENWSCVRVVKVSLVKRAEYLTNRVDNSTWVDVYMSANVNENTLHSMGTQGMCRMMQAAQLRNEMCERVMKTVKM